MNLGVLASHEGSTLQSLLDAFAGGRLPGRVSVVVSNNVDSGALVKARQAVAHDGPSDFAWSVRWMRQQFEVEDADAVASAPFRR